MHLKYTNKFSQVCARPLALTRIGISALARTSGLIRTNARTASVTTQHACRSLPATLATTPAPAADQLPIQTTSADDPPADQPRMAPPPSTGSARPSTSSTSYQKYAATEPHAEKPEPESHPAPTTSITKNPSGDIRWIRALERTCPKPKQWHQSNNMR